MSTLSTDAGGDVASRQSLLTPSSAHPVLDPGTQNFVDANNMLARHFELLGSPKMAKDAFIALQRHTDRKPGVCVRNLTLPTGPGGAVRVSIFTPENAVGTLPFAMYFCGGGWMVGDGQTHERLMRDLCALADIALVYVDYTRSPDGHYPLQNEEAYAATVYCHAHSEELGLQGAHIALVGDCAGGNIVAAVAMLAKRRKGPRIALQVLFYPVLSGGERIGSYRDFESGPWLSRAAMLKILDAQFPSETVRDSLALPAYANFTELEGLPPALIITAENDVVRDEGELYARKLMQGGVEVTATRYLGTIHDFMVLNELVDTPPSRAALRQATDALRGALHPL